MPDSNEPEKKRRKPGRRPRPVHYIPLTITLLPEDMTRLLAQAQQTGRSRSELLRRAWQGLPLTPRVQRGVQDVAFYRELVKLVSNLEELVGKEEFGLVLHSQARVLLDQVQQFISILNEEDTQ
jgi:hypothetical protein